MTLPLITGLSKKAGRSSRGLKNKILKTEGMLKNGIPFCIAVRMEKALFFIKSLFDTPEDCGIIQDKPRQ